MTQEQEALTYDAASISVLEGLEAVRVRPAMYIGDTDVRGLHHLIWEVVDNSMDEALAGYAHKCVVKIRPDGSVSVLDDGRGIPVGIHPTEGIPAVEVALTRLHAGGKFNKSAYKVSGGLHGVGVSCVNALSEWLEVTVWREGHEHCMSFARGVRARALKELGKSDRTGTQVVFKPDAKIFSTTEIDFEIVSKRLREMAYLMGTRGVVIELEDERTGAKERYEFHEGPARLRAAHQQEQARAARRRRAPLEDSALAGPARPRVRGRAGAAVHGHLPGDDLHLRQQHQHARRRHAPGRVAQRVDAHAERPTASRPSCSRTRRRARPETTSARA